MWTERLLSRLLAGTIIAALAFAPLAFGAVEPWAYSVLAVLAYTALALACVRAAVRRSASGFATPILLPAGLALLLVAVQYAEWPVGILKAVSPEAARFYAGAAALTGVEGEAAGFAPSLYRHATRDALIRLSSYVALFLATCAYVRTRKHISTIAGAIVTVGFAVSLIGIVQNLAGTRKLYGWRELTRGGALFGPFVSRNQFASYAGVCLFVGLGLLLAHAAHAAGSTRRWREGLQRVLTCRAHRDFLVAFAVGLIGAAVIWSLSRGGILSLVLSFAGVFLAARLTRFVGGKQLYVAAVCLVIVAWVTYLGWDSVVKRVSTLDEVARDPLATWRWRIYSDAGRMSLRFPLLGTGAGTFLSVYPFYRTLPTDAITVSPHNEYLHVLVETGFGGLAILLLTMGLIYRRVWRGLSDRHYPFARGFLAGGVGALLMVTLHSLVDFPMRSPAIAATMAVTAALLYRATTIKGDRKSVPGALHADPGGNPVGEGADGDPPGETGGGSRSAIHGEHSCKRPAGRMGRGELCVAMAGLVVVGVPWAYLCHIALKPLRGQLLGRAVERAQKNLTPDRGNVQAFVDDAETRAQWHSPDDAQLYASLADLCGKAAAEARDPLTVLNLAARALKLRKAAAQLEPLNADHPFAMAMAYLGFRRLDWARLQADGACKLLPNDPWVRAYLAEGFVDFGEVELAGLYLEKAERLATSRGIEEVQSLIGRIRESLGGVGTP